MGVMVEPKKKPVPQGKIKRQKAIRDAQAAAGQNRHINRQKARERRRNNANATAANKKDAQGRAVVSRGGCAVTAITVGLGLCGVVARLKGWLS